MKKTRLKSARLLLGLYIAFALWLLLFRQRQAMALPYWQHAAARINLIPFRTIRHYFRLLSLHGRQELHRVAAVNLAGNILLLIPSGWLLPAVFPGLRTFGKTMLTAFLSIALIEAAQVLLLVGTCDIDDLILNTIGAAAGYGLYRRFGL